MTPQRSLWVVRIWISVNWKHTINEKKQYSQVPTHNLHLRRKQIFYTKNSWIVFCFLQASCWQRDRQDSASNMPMYIQISSIPLLIEWRWEWGGRRGRQMNYICEASQVSFHPVPHANWKNHLVEGWGVEMSILLFVMSKAPKQTAAITSSTTTEGLVG